MERLTTYCSTRAESLGERKWRFIISNETLDRHGTVIKMDGWRLKNYSLNGIVAYGHITNSGIPDYIIGKGIAYIEKKNLIGEVELEPADINELAVKIDKKLEFGTLRTTSVGFLPYSWSWGIEKDGEDPNILYFRDQDLLEWSIVDIPSNPSATMIDRALGDFVTKVRTASGIELPQEVKEVPDIPPVETKTPPSGPDPYTTEYLRAKRSILKLKISNTHETIG